MTTTRTEPEAAPASAKASDEKWKTSPGGPLDRRGQTSSGERGQTSSGENERADDDKPVTKRARMDSDGSAKTTEGAIDAAEDAAEATNVDAPEPRGAPAVQTRDRREEGAETRRVAAERRAPDRDPRGAHAVQPQRREELAVLGDGHARAQALPEAHAVVRRREKQQRGGAAEGAAGAKTTAVARGGERLGARRADRRVPAARQRACGRAKPSARRAAAERGGVRAGRAQAQRSGAARDESGGVERVRRVRGIPGRDCVFGVPWARPGGCDAPADCV